VYSIKLKMEFRILNQLTAIASHRMRSAQGMLSDESGTINPLASPMPTEDEGDKEQVVFASAFSTAASTSGNHTREQRSFSASDYTQVGSR
jgi:hypothetical protein